MAKAGLHTASWQDPPYCDEEKPAPLSLPACCHVTLTALLMSDRRWVPVRLMFTMGFSSSKSIDLSKLGHHLKLHRAHTSSTCCPHAIAGMHCSLAPTRQQLPAAEPAWTVLSICKGTHLDLPSPVLPIMLRL